MKLCIVMHESFESPAAIARWAELRKCDVAYVKLHEGGEFPTECDFDMLIVMGGPQSPATTTEECPHFDAAKEIAFIGKAIAEDKIIFGVCLGAQMIGEALGAPFAHSPQREIGVFPVTLTQDGKSDPLIGDFGGAFDVGHWHGDMPGLTDQAKILAFSEGCPRQIVRYSPKIYGFQCHFEFTSQAVEAMIAASTDELNRYAGLPYIETPEKLRSHEWEGINALLFRFLDRLTAVPRS